MSLAAASDASGAERIATARGYLTGSPQLVGAGVAWQEQLCIANCGDLVSCPPDGLTNRYAVRLRAPGRPVSTLFRRRLRCAGSGPNSFVETASASVSPRRLALTQRSFSGDDSSEHVTGGLRAGPRAGPLTRVFRCERGDQLGFSGGLSLVALDGDRLAYDTTPCADSRRLAVRDLASGETQPVPHQVAATISAIALAGRYLAYVRSDEAVEVYDYLSGARVYGWEAPSALAVVGFDLDRDGRLAVVTRDRAEELGTCASERLAWHSPAEPQPHPLPGRPCDPTVRIDGERVLFATATALDEVTLSGAHRQIARFGRVDGVGFDSDGQRATYASRTCGGGYAVYRQRLDEGAFSAGSPTCSARIASNRLHASSGRVAVSLRCPRACSGVLRLRRGSSQLAARRFGSERRGAKAIVLRLGASARALLRSRGTIAVTLAVAVEDRDLGEHRVRRAARLRSGPSQLRAPP